MTSASPTPLTARQGGPLTGRIRVPGDKSISHRALILAALTVGETLVSGLLEGEDVLHTAEAMRALGATLERLPDGIWRVHGVGVGGFAEPAGPLDFGNSGTGCRLAIGAVAGCGITATFDGDASLRSRPMRRILDPLEQMGARVVEAAEGGRLPLTLQGALDPLPIEYESPVPSAQLKSAVLLAGLAAPGETIVIEAEATRDHTEKLLKHFGAKIVSKPHGEHGRRIVLQGQPELSPAPVLVPADPSSAAFPMVGALLVPNSDVTFEAVMTNPLRTGLFTTLREMGASIEESDKQADGGEEVANFRVRTSALKGVEVPASRAPSMIDEYLILAVAAAFAEGPTQHARPEGIAGQGERSLGGDRRHAAGQRRHRRHRGRRHDRAWHGRRRCARRRRGRNAHGSSYCDVGFDDGARQSTAGAHRRFGFHRHQLSRLRRD